MWGRKRYQGLVAGAGPTWVIRNLYEPAPDAWLAVHGSHAACVPRRSGRAKLDWPNGLATSMMTACLAKRAHYLDITGEIGVFEHARTLDAAARAAGIVICPGVGFDVIPTDCVAAALKAALPEATYLALGFDSRSGFSPGTAKTSVEGLAQGGKVRQDGRIVSAPLAYKTRRIDFGDGEKLAMTIPWGDVSTAYATSGILNIEVYIPGSPAMVARARRVNRLRWLLGP